MSAEFLEVRPLVLVAATPVRILVIANFFQLMQASSDVTIEFFHNGTLIGTATDVPEGFRRGPVKDGREWDQIRITSTIGQTIQYCLAFGEASLQRIVGNITATLSKAATMETGAIGVGGGASILIAAADANQREIILTVQSAYTAGVLIHDLAAVGVGNGTELQPGQSAVFSTAAAIYATNLSATVATAVDFNRIKD